MEKIKKRSPRLDSRKYDDVCFLGHILCLLDGQISAEEESKLMERFEKEQPCPLFDFCNGKTAVCRVRLPDDDCYWYRWFKRLIKENEEMSELDKDEVINEQS